MVSNDNTAIAKVTITATIQPLLHQQLLLPLIIITLIIIIIIIIVLITLSKLVNCSIRDIDGTLAGTTTPGPNGFDTNVNEGELVISQNPGLKSHHQMQVYVIPKTRYARVRQICTSYLINKVLFLRKTF